MEWSVNTICGAITFEVYICALNINMCLVSVRLWIKQISRDIMKWIGFNVFNSIAVVSCGCIYISIDVINSNCNWSLNCCGGALFNEYALHKYSNFQIIMVNWCQYWNSGDLCEWSICSSSKITAVSCCNTTQLLFEGLSEYSGVWTAFNGNRNLKHTFAIISIEP